MSLSLSRLEAVRSVAETGSFAAAARRIGVSQPAISKQIREIEADYQVRLFRREGGVLQPTPLCLELCDLATLTLDAHARAERLLTRRADKTAGRLVVGLGNAMPGMALVARFHRAYPGVTLQVETGSHERISRLIVQHEVDVHMVETADGPVDSELYTVDDDGGFSAPSDTYLGHILRGLGAAGHDETALAGVRAAAAQAAEAD